jgi:transcriptional regulator with XRE-family HTH domain
MNSLLCSGSLGAVDTLPARLEWILTHCKAPSGGAWTARGLSAAADLSPSYVGMLRRQAVKSPGLDVLRAIATAAGVSLAWLATGDGTPDSDDDARAPSSTESHVPVMGNAIGWSDAETAARARSDYSEEVWDIVRQIAPFAVRGIVSEDDALELARTVSRLSDPARMQAQLVEAYARQQELRARLDAKSRG